MNTLKLRVKQKKQMVKEWISGTRSDLPDENCFLLHPNGTQETPDFLIKYDGKFVLLECKSKSSGSNPAWNDKLPQRGILYFFYSESCNDFTFFFGENVLSDFDREWIDSDMKQCKEIVRKKGSESYRGFGPNVRPQVLQEAKCGGHVNFFNHRHRKLTEMAVLNYARQNV